MGSWLKHFLTKLDHNIKKKKKKKSHPPPPPPPPKTKTRWWQPNSTLQNGSQQTSGWHHCGFTLRSGWNILNHEMNCYAFALASPWGWDLWFWSDMAQQPSDEFLWNFGAHIHDSLRINCNNCGDPLMLHLLPLPGLTWLQNICNHADVSI